MAQFFSFQSGCEVAEPAAGSPKSGRNDDYFILLLQKLRKRSRCPTRPFNTSASLIQRGESREESIESSEPTGETFRRDCVSLLEGRESIKAEE